MTYPLGWSVIERTMVQRERWPGGYQVKGVPLVYRGQEVLPDQPVLRMEYAERVEPVKALPLLALPAVSAPMEEHTLRMRNEPYLTKTFEAAMVPAGLHGRVVDITRRGGVIIECRAAIVQGVLGVGGQVAGILSVWHANDIQRMRLSIPAGAILVVPGPLNFAFLRQALASGVSGIIASSISLRDLEGFLRTDLFQLLEYKDMDLAQMYLPPITLFLTEGVGAFAMPTRVMNLLSQHQGSVVLLSGATSVRRDLFPELIISLPLQDEFQEWHPVYPDLTLTLGAQVRVCAGEHEGATGVIDHFFRHEQVFAGGMRARAVCLRGEDGSSFIVPLALVERIG